MKKVFMILILSIFLPMLLIIPVHAETQEIPVSFEVAATTDYQWSVPAQSLNFVFDNNVFANGTSLTNQEVSITQKNGVPILLPVGASLDISVSSANGYKLQLTSDESSSSVPYHIRKSGESSDIGSTIYSLKAGNTGGGSQFLDFVITADEAKNAKLAGKHTDKLTFEIKQVRPGATFSDGVFLTWEELKLAENGTKYGYNASVITDASIGSWAFRACDNLTSLTIPNSVTSIRYYAFYYCSSLTSITIPDSVTSIGEEAFHYCSSLTSITIPDSVTSIGDYALADCTSLTEINVDANNQNYSSVDGVLFNKEETTLIQYPAGKAGSYTIPNSVTTIGDRAFSGCRSLTSITIPASVTSIGSSAFSSCRSLTEINVDANNQNYSSVDGVLFNKEKTTLIQYPEGKAGSYTISESVTSIRYYAFWQCTNLTSITIPNSVTSIGNFAFEKCNSLTSIEIPESVTSIENSTFSHCNSLTSITIPSSVTYIRQSAFFNCSSLTNITFNGTQAQWSAITKDDSWDNRTGNYTIHCTDGDIAKS